jgi:AcrR family transcriptional regulator
VTFRASFEHHDDLLRAAIKEFSECGYDNASLNRILDAARVSKGQLYHHFDGKEGLYLGLVEWMIDRKLEWFAAHPVEFSEDFLTSLGAQITASVAFATSHPDIDRLSRAVLAERGHPIFSAVTERFGFDPDSALGILIEHAYHQGQFRPDLSLKLVRGAVLTLVNGLPELLDLDAPADLHTRIEEVVTFLRHGLAGPDPAGPTEAAGSA